MIVRTFGKETRENNKRYSRVTINGHSGYLTREFEYTMDADWQPILNFNGKFQLLEEIGYMANSPLFTQGILSKKSYRGGSYIILNIDSRIVDDYDGGIFSDNSDDSPIVNASRSFALACSPLPMNIDKALDLVVQAGGYALDDTILLAQGGLQTVKATLDLNEKTKAGAELKTTINTLYNTGKAQLEKFSKNGVQPINLSIGDYIQNKEFVITSFTSKYSKEVTRRGPLFGDFSMTLSTVEVYDTEHIGDFFKTHTSRITVDGE